MGSTTAIPSKKSIKWLVANNISHEFYDFKKTALNKRAAYPFCAIK